MWQVPDIVDSIDPSVLENGLESVSDRYYEHRYCVQIKGIQDTLHQRVSFHSNRICLLSLAEDHPVIKHDKNITRLNCTINERTDRTKNKVSGKGKRGAQKLSCNSVLCYIECDDNSVYPVYSCVKGKLIEINEKLLKDPNLLKRKPASEGYIALVLPVLTLYNECKSSLLTHDAYVGHFQQAHLVENNGTTTAVAVPENVEENNGTTTVEAVPEN